MEEKKNKKTLLVFITIYCGITIMAASMYIAKTITQLVYDIHDLHQIEAQLEAVECQNDTSNAFN